MNTKLLIQGLALTTMLVSSQFSSAAVFQLCTGETTLTMPDSTTVTMWGYGIDDLTPNCDSASIPGPELLNPPGDTLLTISLRNTLSEATSIMIPALSSSVAPSPVFFTDAQGRQRARALTHEAAAGGGIAIYTFNASAGTYLYQSGSHPAVQVQMGLYGGIKQDAAAGQAYPGIPYENEIVLLYSEIDPALHTAIANNTYGTPAYPTTINYNPKYFLVNGAPYTSTTPDLAAGTNGQTTLIRFLNAGLESHVPVLQGRSMNLIAEYGSPYPHARNQYSFLLAAGQTTDALFTPDTAERYALYDRRLRLTNNTQTGGGLMSFLNVSPAAGNPVAASDITTTDEDTPLLALDLAINDTDVGGSIDLDSIHIPFQPVNGTVVANNNGTGTVTYTPNTDFNGVDTFSYVIKDNLGNLSATADVTITVNSVNDAPVATDDTYDFLEASVLNIAAPGVLDNDTDADPDTLTAVLQTDVTLGTLFLNTDGSFTYTPNTNTTTDSFTYVVSDGTTTSNTATVTLNEIAQFGATTLVAPSGPIATNTPTYTWNRVVNSDWYYLWVVDSTGTNVIKQWYTAAQVGCPSNEATCSITPTTALANGNAQFWVQTYNNINGNGPWSSPSSFFIGSIPVAATLNQPTGLSATSTPTYDWNAVSSSTWYLLYVTDSTGNAINTWYTAAQAGCANGELTCSITPTTVLADGDAQWWIRTYNDAGTGPWSSGLNFFVGSTPAAVTLIQPSGNITDTTPTYSWNAVSNASWYYLWVDDSTGNVIKQWYTAALAGCGNGEAVCIVTPSTVLASGAGSWRIQTFNTAGLGPWSAIEPFLLP